MKLFIDSANTGQIRRVDTLGIISGITTNPVILAKEGKPPLETVKALCAAFPEYPVFAQVTGPAADDMAKQAAALAAVSPRLVVKIPACEEGLAALARIRRERLFENEICATTVLTAVQALLCAAAGANYVAPYMGDVDGIGYGGMATLADMVASLAGTGTKVLAAAAERAQDMVEAAKCGAHILTASPAAYLNALQKPRPLTQWYLDLFRDAAEGEGAAKGGT